MLFVVDVGNTNISLGIYCGEELVCDWRIRTQIGRTADEYGMLFRELFEYSGLRMRDVNGIAISNVVPPAMRSLLDTCHKFFGIDPYVVDPMVDTDIAISYQPRSAVGADRIVNTYAVYRMYGGPAIVADFGTATTYDALSTDGVYLGGAIAPGIGISVEALNRAASRLPRIQLACPPKAVGDTTETSMQSGIVFGFAGQVDAMVARFRKELGADAKVIATGGLAELIGPETESIQIVNPLLTLQGLRLMYERPRG